MKKATGINSNIQDLPIKNHRYGKRLSNNDYGTIAFLISKDDILKDKRANANSFYEAELKYNCIYFLIGYDNDNEGNSIEKIYVGQAGIRDNQQSVLDRLNEHTWLGNDPAKYIDKWNHIVVVTNEKGAWGATELDALEHIFWSLIPVGNRLNSQKPSCTGADLEKYTNAVNQIKEYLDYLEFSTFKERTAEDIDKDIKKVADSKSDIPIDLDHGTSRIPNITTPLKVINQMLDMLPNEVWNDKTVFLDPACKDGGYLKAIYDRLISMPDLLQKYDNNKDKLSNHILSEQLYGIALNQNSRAVTIDKLNGFGYNICVIPNYIAVLKYLTELRIKEKHIDTAKITKDLMNKEFGADMKFDIVIGNPPYQESNGGGREGMSATAIYHRFIQMSMDLNAEYICMITKDSWITYSGFDELRINMIKYGIANIIDYPIIGEVFDKQSVNVAVAILLLERGLREDTNIKCIEKGSTVVDYNFNAKETGYIPSCEIESLITSKIKQVSKDSFDKYVYSAYPFGIKSNNVDMKGFPIDENIAQSEEYDIKMMCLDNSKKAYWSYIKRDNISKHYDIIANYKLICGLQFNKNSTIITNIHGLNPHEICNGSFGVIYNSINKTEVENVYKYICSRFFRCLIYFKIDTKCTVAPYRLSLIPDQDFTYNSDIDWSQPLFNIDKQLYNKYKLTDKEIDYIEKTIKPMDNSYNDSSIKVTTQDIQANYIHKMIHNQ